MAPAPSQPASTGSCRALGRETSEGRTTLKAGAVGTQSGWLPKVQGSCPGFVGGEDGNGPGEKDSAEEGDWILASRDYSSNSVN